MTVEPSKQKNRHTMSDSQTCKFSCDILNMDC